MIRAVFFDAAGTMIHLPRGAAYHYRLVAARHGLDLDEEELAAAFRSAWQARPERAVVDGPRPDDEKSWWRKLVSDVLAALPCACGEEKFSQFFDDVYAHFAEPGVWALYPEVRPLLDALRGRFALGVISNFDRRLLRVLSDLGIADYFSAIILSSETGADKPHPQIFRRALHAFRVAPHEALHAGDDPVHDWQGAESAGLHVFKLDRKKNSLADLPRFPGLIPGVP